MIKKGFFFNMKNKFGKILFIIAFISTILEVIYGFKEQAIEMLMYTVVLFFLLLLPTR